MSATVRRVVVPVRRRTVTVCLAVVGVSVVLSLLTLSLGRLGLSAADLRDAVTGDLDARSRFVLERLRGPRLLVAVGVGIALGIAGALFQTVTRNPLGSPDVIGLAAGAGAGVAVTVVLGSTVPAPVGAVLGAGAAIGVVYLANGSGFASPARVIITGIGVAAMCTAVTQYVVAVEMRDSAHALAAYTVGSLSARDLGHAATIGGGLLLLLPCVAALHHRLLVMDMGDELCDALGARASATRTWAIVLSVLLAAVAVSVSGPISFVALTAPHVARRLTGAVGPNLVASALVGVLIVLSADVVAQHVPAAEGLPVGVVTIGVGGAYLGYLLLVHWRNVTT